jgi:hypothetical protein
MAEQRSSERSSRAAWWRVGWGLLGLYLLLKYGRDAITAPSLGTIITPLVGLGMLVEAVLVVLWPRDRR